MGTKRVSGGKKIGWKQNASTPKIKLIGMYQ